MARLECREHTFKKCKAKKHNIREIGAKMRITWVTWTNNFILTLCSTSLIQTQQHISNTNKTSLSLLMLVTFIYCSLYICWFFNIPSNPFYAIHKIRFLSQWKMSLTMKGIFATTLCKKCSVVTMIYLCVLSFNVVNIFLSWSFQFFEEKYHL